MAPEPAVVATPNWNTPQGNDEFIELALKSPGLSKPGEWPRLLKQTQEEYFGRYEDARAKIARLVSENFPPAKPDQVVTEHSGPQGQVKPFTIIDDPADWKASTWEGREAEYTYVLTEEDLAEIDAAVQGLKARGLSTEADIKALTKADFPLPKLGPKLVELGKEVSHGRGFQYIRGFPVHKYAEDPFYVIAAYWGFGLHLGRAQITQHEYNEAPGKIEGSVLNHIVNLGQKTAKGVRQFHSGTPLPFHADQGATDIGSLLVISPPVEGGEAKWVSSIAIHNELLRRGRKDLVEVLSKPFLLPKMATQLLPYRNAADEFEWEEITPFEYHDGYLSVYFQGLQYFTAERVNLKLTPLQEEAVWAVIALSERPEFHVTHVWRPSEIEWLHNPSVQHAREPYVDGEVDNQKRHLVRLWVHSDANRRPIAPSFAPRSNVQAGGGFRVPPGTVANLPLLPIAKSSA